MYFIYFGDWFCNMVYQLLGFLVASNFITRRPLTTYIYIQGSFFDWSALKTDQLSEFMEIPLEKF